VSHLLTLQTPRTCQFTAPGGSDPFYDGIILAGDREKGDALHRHSGTSKAMARINGTPMIHRVINALRDSASIGSIHLSGPDEDSTLTDRTLSQWIRDDVVSWRPPEASPSISAYRTLSSMPETRPTLLTTADHPLLTSEIVDHFCRASAEGSHDVVVGIAPHDLVQAAHPDMKKTVLSFRDGDYCSCNLFAFMTPRGREVADFWRRIENERKKPLLLIRLLGWTMLLRYRLGLLSLDSALQRLSSHLGLSVGAVVLPYANAAVDVDSVADYQLIQDYSRNGEAPDSVQTEAPARSP